MYDSQVSKMTPKYFTVLWDNRLTTLTFRLAVSTSFQLLTRIASVLWAATWSPASDSHDSTICICQDRGGSVSLDIDR